MSPFCAYEYTVTDLCFSYVELEWTPLIEFLDTNLILVDVGVSVLAYGAIFAFIVISVGAVNKLWNHFLTSMRPLDLLSQMCSSLQANPEGAQAPGVQEL